MYASNFVHHMPIDISPSSNNKIFNSLMFSSHSATSNMHSINVHSGDHLVHPNGTSYTANMPMSTTAVHGPSWIMLDHLLMEDPTVAWLALTSTCLTAPNNVQTLQE